MDDLCVKKKRNSVFWDYQSNQSNGDQTSPKLIKCQLNAIESQTNAIERQLESNAIKPHDCVPINYRSIDSVIHSIEFNCHSIDFLNCKKDYVSLGD